MILVTGTITFDPTKAPNAHEHINTLVTATRAEAGCISYLWAESTDAPGVFAVIEQWQDNNALDSHMGTAHMAEFLGKADDIGLMSADVWKHDVADSTKLM